MRKVTAIVVYSEKTNYFQIYNMTVKTKDCTNIKLVSYSKDSDLPHKYALFQDMYQSILNILKNNNFYVKSWKDYGCLWYDIDFVNADTYDVQRYAFMDC